MHITDINDRVPIVEAIHEFDQLGRDRFLRTYGFKDAREFWLIHQGRRYDSKAIVGVACKYVPGSKGPLKASEFSGGHATVQRLLEALGFEVEVRKSTATGLSELESAGWFRSSIWNHTVTQSPDFTVYGVTLASRLMLGTSHYPSPAILADAARASEAGIVTVSLRRESARLREGQDFWRLIRDIGVRVLPNTAGCYSVKEAVTTAQMAREVFGTPWVKVEVIGEADTLQPDVFGLVEAARILAGEGFEVFPYTTEDLVVAERLLEAGCRVLMPWGAPIGSGKGLNNVFGLRALRAHFPEVPLIVDAGVGLPSHAAAAMELGYDGVLLNTAVAKAGDPVAMARAFAQAIEAGRAAFLAGPMEARDMAAPSTPVVGRAALT
jgi:thiazole synthase